MQIQPPLTYRTRIPWPTIQRRHGTILLLVLVLLIAWLFRANWSDRFAYVLGDRYDSLIEIAILEHWYNVLRGLAHWSRTHYFYPYPATLGYNDGYLVYGLIYAVPRALGADPLLAAMLVMMTMKVAAFAFMFLFLRSVQGLGYWLALLGATIFILSNNIVSHVLHAQLLTVAFAPLCGWLLYHAAHALLAHDAQRLLRFGAGFVLTYAAWALTSFYMLWFFSVFTLLLLLVLALTQWRHWWPRMVTLGHSTVVVTALLLLLQAAALLPFLKIYLPKARETGMHGFSSALGYAPTLSDTLNIGVGNYVYGALVRILHARLGFPAEFSETQMGITPLLLLAFLAGAWLSWRQRRHAGVPLMAAMALTTLLLWALMLKIDGHTAWYAIYQYLPGAKAVRVVSRAMIFLVFPVICVAMYFLTTIRPKTTLAMMIPICTLLVLEQGNRTQANAIDRRAVLQLLASVPSAPASCRMFYVLDPRPAPPGESEQIQQLYRHNVDAMLIAEYRNLPTINGFSSFNPPDWQFEAPQRPDYLARVGRYRDAHGLQGLCALDLQSSHWVGPI